MVLPTGTPQNIIDYFAREVFMDAAITETAINYPKWLITILEKAFKDLPWRCQNATLINHMISKIQTHLNSDNAQLLDSVVLKVSCSTCFIEDPVHIEINNKEYVVSRDRLMKISPFFHKALENSFLESINNKIILNDLPGELAVLFQELLLTGLIQPSIFEKMGYLLAEKKDKKEDFFSAIGRLQLPEIAFGLLPYCQDEVLEFLYLAYELQHEKMQIACINILNQGLDGIVIKIEDWSRCALTVQKASYNKEAFKSFATLLIDFPFIRTIDLTLGSEALTTKDWKEAHVQLQEIITRLPTANFNSLTIDDSLPFCLLLWTTILKMKPKLSKIDLSYCTWVTDEQVFLMAMICPDLRKISLKACPKITGNILTSLNDYCEALDTLDISLCTNLTDVPNLKKKFSSLSALVLGPVSSDLNNQSIAKLLKSCLNLKMINLRQSQVEDSTIELMSKHNPYLEEVDLSDCDKIGLKSLISLNEHCRESLLSLILAGCDRICTIKPLEIRDQLKAFNKLALLDLARLKGLPPKLIDAFLKNCKHLTWVDFTECGTLTDDHVHLLASNNPELTYVNLSSCSLTSRSIQTLNQHCPRISSLILRESFASLAFLEPLKQFNNLRKLELVSSSALSLQDFSILIKSCPNLIKLILNDSHNEDKDYFEVLVKSCPNLQELSSNCFPISSLQALQALNVHSKELRTLSLSNIFVVEEEEVFFEKKFENLTSLTASSWGKKIFKPFLSVCPQLFFISITRCDFSGDELTTLSRTCSNLQEIKINDCYELTGIGFDSLNQHCLQLNKLSLKNCPNLMVESFSKNFDELTCLTLNELNSESVIAFIQSSPNLSELYLDSIDITQTLMQAIANHSFSLKTLSFLDCMHTCDMDIFFSLLYETAKHSSELSALTFSHAASVKDEHFEALAKVSPRLEILILGNARFVTLKLINKLASLYPRLLYIKLSDTNYTPKDFEALKFAYPYLTVFIDNDS